MTLNLGIIYHRGRLNIIMSNLNNVKAICFDVFGTVVDYRSSIIKEGERWNQTKNLTINWAKFVDKWRGRYRPNITRVLNGDLPWMNLDSLHKMVLHELLEEFEVANLSEEEINQLNECWHRLEPWEDSVPGLNRLKKKFILSPLSNGNIALQTRLAKYSRLPWDVILSPELIKSYKPDKNVYLMAAELLALKPEEILMVAAHQYDLQAAKKLGMKTAYILRPLEYGSNSIPDLRPTESYDIIGNDIIDLAKQLGV